MRPSKIVSGPFCAAALLLACTACSGDPAPPTAAPRALSATTAAPSPSTHAPPPLPATAEPTPKPTGKPTTTPGTAKASAAPAPGTCGTVTAASGLTLYVYDPETVPCGQALTLVKDFHEAITGRQGSGSNEAVDATVDGWRCTSGPPSAQGGTTCDKGAQTVFAAVVPAE
ncbi:hypothetical protein [Amycolatopsis jiangsuensis]|uniref:Uncharacterized protein n=1 Tax=Amycolatopsis jiangsuensis TaxID=1181879 RepID=A0A840IPI5_9PSEU|nr:hypothetical protein [Amycolatopsis jiangsuensis]MBB4683365.1 hypothetical protein [Amycolatopsis jiangsuensis]